MHNLQPRTIAQSLLALILGLAGLSAAIGADAPSRAAQPSCQWQHRSDPTLGLDSWVQACDFGDRKVDFVVVGKSLAQRFSDGGAPDPVVDVIDLNAGESIEQGLRRFFDAHTQTDIARRCVAAKFAGEWPATPAVVRRYSFVPDAAYAKELARTQNPDEVGDPPCGDYGDAPDGVQYFESEVDSKSRKVLFVRVGQDEPLFDDANLRLLPEK